MRRVRQVLVASALLALAACNAPADTVAAQAPSAATTETPPPLDPAIAAGEIPQRYHGSWDAEGGSCNTASQHWINIAARRITFHDGVGNAAGIGNDGDEPIVDLVMEGAAPMTLESIKLHLTTAGGREALLLLPGYDEPKGRPMPRFRCPA